MAMLRVFAQLPFRPKGVVVYNGKEEALEGVTIHGPCAASVGDGRVDTHYWEWKGKSEERTQTEVP